MHEWLRHSKLPLCSSTTRTLLPKLLQEAVKQLLFHDRGGGGKIIANLLSAHIYPPDNSWTWTKRRERGWDFSSPLAGSSRFHLTQLPITQVTPLLDPCIPPKTPSVCLQTDHLYMHTDSMQGERFKRKISFSIHYVSHVFPFHSALSIKNILTQKPVPIKVSIPWTFKDKPYLITGALTTEI